MRSCSRSRRVRLVRGAIRSAVSAAALLSPLHAQEPEVRRAIPVERQTPEPSRPEPPTARAVPFDNPAWMQRLPQQSAPAATPTPEPFSTPFRPQPSPSPIAEPAATPAVATTPDEAGSIRIGATASAQSPFELANSLYARKLFDLAVVEYERALIAEPSAPGRDSALFRLAECQRFLHNDEAARSGYERLLKEFREGEFVGAGAYRLAEILFAEKSYDPALTQFQVAAANARDPSVRLSAGYYIARCLHYLDRKPEAAEAYARVVAEPGKNPYLDFARLAGAELAADAGKKDDALQAYEKLADSAEKPAVRAESTVKAAALAAGLKKTDEARKLFERALKLPDAGEWRPVAQLGALRLAYEAGDYKAVAATPDAAISALPGETLPEALLIVANAQRQLGNHQAARKTYDRIMREFPNGAPSQDARFHRLVSLYALNDPNTIKEIDDFVLGSQNDKERAQAGLLKAETLFKNGKYADAAKVYRAVLAEDLPDAFKTEALFKMGWAQGQSDDAAGAQVTLTSFLDKNPDHPLAPSALAQRAISRQQLKDYEGALADFSALAEKYPTAKEREAALQQQALLLGQLKRNPEMVEAFKKLLADYPKTRAAALANFWIGWAAFEAKDYAGAVEPLDRARTLDAKAYGDKATLRIVLSYYYREDAASTAKELDRYKLPNTPPEILTWLGTKYFEAGDYPRAERFLAPLADAGGAPASPDLLLVLAQSQIKQGKFKSAKPSIDRFLETARDPASRAKGLLASASVSLGLKNYDQAAGLAGEVLMLQPEGNLNAEGRMLLAEVQMAKGDADPAARAFMTVAVLYDDPRITPAALRRAADAYRKSGNTAEAEKALQELKKRYPDSPEPKPAPRPNA